MSFTKKSISAFGKLIVVAVLAATFLVGMLGVVYMSLQGEELKVPDLIGKDYTAGEEELASLGLRIKKRADRVSGEKPNTILEQLPKAGETVKTGQMILVVRSKFDPNAEEDDKPATLKQDDDEDDSSKIEELISDKPKVNKKTNTNSNKKKTSTTRDVIADKSNDNSAGGDSGKNTDSNTNSSKSGKDNSTPSGNKSTTPGDSKKDSDTKKPPEVKKPAEADKSKTGKTPAAEARPRKTPVQ